LQWCHAQQIAKHDRYFRGIRFGRERRLLVPFPSPDMTNPSSSRRRPRLGCVFLLTLLVLEAMRWKVRGKSRGHVAILALWTCLWVVLPAGVAQVVQGPNPPQAPAPELSLDQAMAAALANDPTYAASVAAHGSAKVDASLARSALLPSATATGQYLYTQPSGLHVPDGQGGITDGVIFIANNAVHEYIGQLLVNENLSVAGFANLARTRALAARAAADLESARRDLALRVVQLYFGLLDAQSKLEVAKQARDEALNFAELTQKLERGREVAHADVVKAELEFQQRDREQGDASLAEERARLDLGTLLFPDPRSLYTLAVQPVPPPLPSLTDVQEEASHRNPDLRSAIEASKAADAAVSAARAGYLPSFSFNYTYGIDAPEVEANGPGHVRNLGYSAFGTIDFPVWDWFATHEKVKQSQLEQKAARIALTATQRMLIAQLQEYYNEARVAYAQVASLKTSVETAQESLRLTRLRYQAGEATALEVVDAENSLALVQGQQADGILRYRVALANLQTLTGVF
jgi:outer membrane protein